MYQTKRKKNKSKKKRNKNKTTTGKRRKRYIPRDIKKTTTTIENSKIKTTSTAKFGLKESQPGFDDDEEIQLYDIEEDNEITLDKDDLLDMVIFDRNPYQIFSLNISSFGIGRRISPLSF